MTPDRNRDYRKLKIVLFKTAAIITGISAGFVLGDIICGLFWPFQLYSQQGREKAANIRLVDGIQLWDTSDDMRYTAQELSQASQAPSAITITGLGDSIMYGVGLNRHETYIEQLGEKLEKNLGLPVKTINLAAPGYNLAQEAAIFKEKGIPLKPDLVLIHLWDNDIEPAIIINGYPVYVNAPVALDGALHTIPLPDWINGALLLRSTIYQRLSFYLLIRRGKQAPPLKRKNARAYLASIKKNADISGAKTILFFSPPLDEGRVRPYPDSKKEVKQTYHMVAGWANELDIETIDLGMLLEGKSSARVGLDDCHFNALGHRLLADALAPRLAETIQNMNAQKQKRVYSY